MLAIRYRSINDLVDGKTGGLQPDSGVMLMAFPNSNGR